MPPDFEFGFGRGRFVRVRGVKGAICFALFLLFLMVAWVNLQYRWMQVFGKWVLTVIAGG